MEYLETLCALEGAVMACQALVLVWAGEVCQIMATYTTLGAWLPCLQGSMLWGLQSRVRLQEYAIDSTAQWVLSSAWGQRVFSQGWRGLCMVLRLWLLWLLWLSLWWLLPAFRHTWKDETGFGQ